MYANAEVLPIIPTQFKQIETRFETENGVLWGYMNPKPRPTFNLQLLEEARKFGDEIAERDGEIWLAGQRHRINYVVEASKVEGVYSLGGDLDLFRTAIAKQD